MDCLDAIRTRRSTHKYSSQPVEFEKIIAICEAGSLAPSAGNLQNWRFLVITDKQIIKNKLFEACLEQECVQCAQAAILIIADEDMVERHYGLRGKRLYSIQNCAAAGQNMLLAAHCLGLGAAWIGAFNEERIQEMFDIPENARPQAIITLGYPDETPPDKRLRHIDDVVRFGTYKGRYKDMHILLKDLSEEWEKRRVDAKDRAKDAGGKTLDACKDFLAKCQNMIRKDKD